MNEIEQTEVSIIFHLMVLIIHIFNISSLIPNLEKLFFTPFNIQETVDIMQRNKVNQEVLIDAALIGSNQDNMSTSSIGVSCRTKDPPM